MSIGLHSTVTVGLRGWTERRTEDTGGHFVGTERERDHGCAESQREERTNLSEQAQILKFPYYAKFSLFSNNNMSL